jgi:hypothetical protein
MAEFKALQFEKLDTKRDLQLLLGRAFGVPDLISTDNVRHRSVARALVVESKIEHGGERDSYYGELFAAGLAVAERLEALIVSGELDEFFMDFEEAKKAVLRLQLLDLHREEEAGSMANLALKKLKTQVSSAVA